MNRETFKTTKNIYLAACFLCAGANLRDVDKTEERHQKFIFDYLPTQTEEVPNDARFMDLDQIEMAFANKTLLVNAVEYGEAIRQLKSVIHSS